MSNPTTPCTASDFSLCWKGNSQSRVSLWMNIGAHGHCLDTFGKGMIVVVRISKTKDQDALVFVQLVDENNEQPTFLFTRS